MAKRKSKTHGEKIVGRLRSFNERLDAGETIIGRTVFGAEVKLFRSTKKEIAMPKKRAKKTVAKKTAKEKAEAKRLPATAKFEERIKDRITAAVINMAFLTLLFEFLMAAFENSQPDAARITRRLAYPNRWHRGRMVRNVFRDADGDLTRRESRQMVDGVSYEARVKPTETVAMIQEGLDEMKRLREMEAAA